MILVPVGALLALASLVLGFSVRRDVPAVDRGLHLAAEDLGSGFTHSATVVSFVLSPGLATIALLSLVARAALARDPLVLRAAALLGACWSTVFARHFYQRVRPIDFPKWSYPSGHVTAVAAVAFTAVVLTAHLARRHLRAAVALAVAAVGATAASRVVLEMHWFTDTAGAILAVTGVGLLVAHALRLLPLGVGSRREQS
ncbi:phosphatase PAP2 family protein [Saccharothrix longispora]|uniref:phosphatase PAP2 family protein n=1 Tax=Saccharothrix longispora TaxID=33920 RepID=UPI0028FD3911|nr:phosphatase PAP2 family protein [Saccharothrix longispora]MDU0293713.1 phosphatase PAP2 family protein [Saccharothrix longispora]